MRTPDEFAEIATNSTSVEECIKRLGIADEHVKASHELPAYARVLTAFVREAIKGDPRGRPYSEDTVGSKIRQEMSARNGLFPISQEEARSAATERLITTVERWRSPLWIEDDGTEVTMRMAWQSTDVLDRVIVAIAGRAADLQRDSDNEIRLLEVLRELSRRQRSGEG